tara:strand:+ start:107 stop:907 length:801 start_codon:yes stop_codon:yes gene_type:complete
MKKLIINFTIILVLVISYRILKEIYLILGRFFDNLALSSDSLLIINFSQVYGALDKTFLLLLYSLPIGFLLSLLFALGRVSKIYFLAKSIAFYIFVIRGTPLLVQIYLIYFGLGSIEAIRNSFLWIALKEPFWCGVIALTANTVAYGSEIFRGGIQSVSQGQIESGKSLGFNKINLYRRIIFPIAIRQVLPTYGNELILMVKATSLISLTTYMEMTGVARKIMAKTFAPVEAFLAAGILYLFLNFLMVQFVKYLEWKYNPHLRLKN